MYGTAKEKRMDWKASLIEEKFAIVWRKVENNKSFRHTIANFEGTDLL